MPEQPNELPLMEGDYVYTTATLSPGKVVEEEEEEGMEVEGEGGTSEGTSWLTGCSGLVPNVHLARAPESDAWTLHR